MLTAQLTGGLGNQLFTYARLALLAHEQGTNLRIDGSVTERVLGHRADLFDFNLMGEEILTLDNYGRIGTQLERLLWRSSSFRKWTKRHQDAQLGGSVSETQNVDGWKFRGFYQNFRVMQEFMDKFSANPFTLRVESKYLRELTESLIKTKPIAVHVRRGDYLNYKDSFGVLDDNYYLGAIDVLQERLEVKNVLIFSDSPEMIDGFTSKLSIPFEVVNKNILSTSENLVLMSRCNGLITSNSTYSFWAAALSKHNNVVIPQPWFKSKDDWLNSSDFHNPQWLSQNSAWAK